MISIIARIKINNKKFKDNERVGQLKIKGIIQTLTQVAQIIQELRLNLI
jgi:hypothetical protein